MDDMTPLRSTAVSTHELYLEYVKAGFTRSQAMQLVCTAVAASFGNGAGGGRRG